jgi:threonine synthase
VNKAAPGGVIARWKARLPVNDRTPVVTLLEGNTPLIPAPRLARAFGLPESSLHLKFEGMNPTGSFKDRGMTLAVSKALEEKTRGVLCASTGNTAASAAAYAARAGIRCLVLLPHGHVALGKLSQALIHGAEVIEVQGNFDAALSLAREAAIECRLTVVNSINPYRLEGQKTAAFEVLDQLGHLPTFQFMPVGNAGNITAYWKGYKEIVTPGRRLPRMMGFQAAGADPLVRNKPIENPKTVATAIRIGKPASWGGAIAARDESGGTIDRVSDAEILAAYRLIARVEGVFCEPSSAAGVAGLLKYARRGFFRNVPKNDLRIVCVLTGHGLKDPDSALKTRRKWSVVPANLRALRRAIGAGS